MQLFGRSSSLLLTMQMRSSSRCLLGVLLVTLTFSLSAARKGSCPAKDNTLVPWGTGENLLVPSKCKDKSVRCRNCDDLCDDDTYSHWITENCPETCGLCTSGESHLPSSDLMSESAVWSFYRGYMDSDVLSRNRFTTVKSCQDMCLANRACVGAFLTEYYKLSNMECVLAKKGSLVERKYMFGITRERLEANPAGTCDDYAGSSTCSRWACRCNSRCPYLVKLLSAVCPETCKMCQGENEEEEKDDNSPTWKIQKGKKMKGEAAVKRLSLEDAKKKCCELGADCKGITCKKNKCKVMTSVANNLKNDSDFTSYTKE